MLLQDKLNQILPPTMSGIHAHITSQYGEVRLNGTTHKGVDFNYVGGQTTVNLTHPKLYSPVDGKVTFVGGNFGTVKIQDKQGYSHELLHLHTQKVKVGEVVKLGEEIGTMGGKGPLGHFQYSQHVHYQIKNAIGVTENPNDWWKNKLPIESIQTENDPVEVAIGAEKLTFQDIFSEPVKAPFIQSESENPIIITENSLAAFDVQGSLQIELI